MPELPEVEITKRGIEPYIINNKLINIQVLQPKLRYLMNPSFAKELIGHKILSVSRRAKYLILKTKTKKIILHLGMSGSLRIEHKNQNPLRKHDHVVFEFADELCLHFHDPRRFGFILDYAVDFTPEYLLKLAPEPLTDAFNSDYLQGALKNRHKAIKVAIMDQTLVVGVGNIYASETLFMTKIHPETPCNQLTPEDIEMLVKNIKIVLALSIEQGGTTLKDFINPNGNPGYFVQQLAVYGQIGKECKVCNTLIERKVLGQRATFWCPKCQQLSA
ncbi:formamidopyrimidine/5-formyluracil/5-hydroxymethy luracil DNA glycosylase [Gammaproteobacteria bacterium]|nr:formamidopyrimidine/5-formyluracil/5-hydroxymethy luracil DNA glycosylase [Gammaproteobacteria bacterium]